MEEIFDNDNALRRVVGNPSHIKPDGTLSSLAFIAKKDEDGVSVDIERMTTIENAVVDRTKFRLFKLIVSEIRSLSLDCIHNPVLDNNAHALIIGEGITKKSTSRMLAKKAIRVL